jgi:hypothetical protein
MGRESKTFVSSLEQLGHLIWFLFLLGLFFGEKKYGKIHDFRLSMYG